MWWIDRLGKIWSYLLVKVFCVFVFLRFYEGSERGFIEMGGFAV